MYPGIGIGWPKISGIDIGWSRISGIGIGWHQSSGIGIGWNFGIGTSLLLSTCMFNSRNEISTRGANFGQTNPYWNESV